MNNTLFLRTLLITAAWTGMQVQDLAANNIAVTNVGLYDLDTVNSNIQVKFDVSWDHCWRISTNQSNWDAAWVFVKYRLQGSNEWLHVNIATNGHTPAAGSAIDVGMTDGVGVGVFIYRSGGNMGIGSVDFDRVRLRWNYGDAGLQEGDNVEVDVIAIEMVYIPEGPFYLGSGGGESGCLYEGGGGTSPFYVTNAGPITCTNAAGCLWGASQSGGNSMGGVGTISNAFLNGYNAFYCMKYEISQGQYAEFLSMLTDAQDGNRYPNQNGFSRHTISGSYSNYTASAPDRACNHLSWADGAAYADWAGLRPMTELEFEKVCRGPETPVPGDYAWGSNNIHSSAYHLDNIGQPNEIVNDPGSGMGNASYNTTDAGTGGPLRCGIFAASVAMPTRTEAGATYYGVMEMTGNLGERLVTIGDSKGRSFTGTHGDGVLDAAGNATNGDWPTSSGTGAGFRGGYWTSGAIYARVSDRFLAASGSGARNNYVSWRGVRSAP